MKDFTVSQYKELLQTLQQEGYQFLTVEQYADAGSTLQGKTIVLRHDVDLLPLNSLMIAAVEHHLGIRATYYFRIVPESNQPEIIRQIARLGHEIGYHYEDLSTEKGNLREAWFTFQTHLEYFRSFYPVSTICMHGAPRSGYDGRDLWKQYDYKALGIKAEPYLDFDYSRLFYLTDTGRRWDGYKVSVRDRIPHWQEEWKQQGLVWHTTPQLTEAIRNHKLPETVLITTHPQRWTDDPLLWYKELVSQNLKNMVKRLLLFLRGKQSKV